MFKIGNVEIKNNIVLAPMAGVCNSAFRKIIKEMGCGLIYAEMVSDKAITYGNEKTFELLISSNIFFAFMPCPPILLREYGQPHR